MTLRSWFDKENIVEYYINDNHAYFCGFHIFFIINTNCINIHFPSQFYICL